MADDCIFCAIVDGSIPSRTVYEDSETIAFLDANPLAPGHTLVIPRDHHERLHDLTPTLASSVLDTLYALVEPVETAVAADGSTVAFNNGPAAGQEIDHVHGHIIPRFDDDDGGPIHVTAGTPPELDESELDEIAAAIADGQDAR